MRNKQQRRAVMLLTVMVLTLCAGSRLRADVGNCNGANLTLPFTDVAGNTFFCQIAEAYFAGLTNGTSPTTYGPASAVPREQMAAFVTRALDQSLQRGSRRAALKEFWTPKGSFSIPLTSVGLQPLAVACDGADVWVANFGDGNGNGGIVSRVRASDGKLLETWTGTNGALRVLVAKGRIYVLGYFNNMARLYRIDPTQPAGAATTLNLNLGDSANDIAFDGDRIWIAGGGLYFLSFGLVCGPCVTQVATGISFALGLVYDGANMWVIDIGDHNLKKLDADGNVVLAVPLDFNATSYGVFDGTNIWIPIHHNHSVVVVRAATGAVVATLTGNGLSGPRDAAFDGERILVTNNQAGNGNTVSLWKATDLSPLGSVQVSFDSDGVTGACSDGVNFWLTLRQSFKLARF